MVVVSHFLIGFCLFRVAAAMSLLVAGTGYSLCITGGVILATEVPAAMLLLHSWVLRRWMVFQGLHCACPGDLKCLDHLRTFHNATTSDPAPLKTKSLCTGSIFEARKRTASVQPLAAYHLTIIDTWCFHSQTR